MIYIIFIIVIILLNGYLLCKKCFLLLKTSPMIDDGMHEGEYSHIGMISSVHIDPVTGLETGGDKTAADMNPFAQDVDTSKPADTSKATGANKTEDKDDDAEFHDASPVRT